MILFLAHVLVFNYLVICDFCWPRKTWDGGGGGGMLFLLAQEDWGRKWVEGVGVRYRGLTKGGKNDNDIQ